MKYGNWDAAKYPSLFVRLLFLCLFVVVILSLVPCLFLMLSFIVPTLFVSTYCTASTQTFSRQILVGYFDIGFIKESTNEVMSFFSTASFCSAPVDRAISTYLKVTFILCLSRFGLAQIHGVLQPTGNKLFSIWRILFQWRLVGIFMSSLNEKKKICVHVHYSQCDIVRATSRATAI